MNLRNSREVHLDVPGPGSDRINGDRINGLVITYLYKWGIPWGEKTH